MRRRAAWPLALAVAAGLLTSCGEQKPEKEPSMTPDQAYTTTRAVVADVLDALQPGASATIGESDRNGPCGGLGGNEFTKIQASVGGEVTTAPSDPTEAGDRVRRAAEKAGWTVQVRTVEGGVQVALRGEAGSGDVVLGDDGRGTVRAQSVCLPNPDSEDPFPDVQPRSTPS